MSDTSDFEFEEGDRVLVRHRENGTSGRILAKFEANVLSIEHNPIGAGSDFVLLELPFNATVRLRPYQAEFEVIDDD